MEYPHRGEIYLIDFSPSVGREMKDVHPCIVLQNDVANKVSGLTIVAAITSNLRVANLPVGVMVTPEESGRSQKSVVHLGHIYTVDKRRLVRYIGRIAPHKLNEINQAIEISLGLKRFRL